MRKINPGFLWLNFVLVYIPTSSTIAIIVVVVDRIIIGAVDMRTMKVNFDK